MEYKRYAFILAFLILPLICTGQVKNLRLSAGISTIEILGDSPNSKTIVNRDTNVVTVGGSFNGTQPGFGFRAQASLDENNIYSIPFGFDYYFFEGLERIPAPGSYTAKWRHTADIMTFTAGFNYAFVKFPLANVRGYASFELRGSYIMQGEIVQTTINSQTDSVSVNEYVTKESAFRLGGAIYIGFMGDIEDPLYINFYTGLGIMNLIGRDDNRGELLTPINYYENKESLVYNLHFSLQIQYRL